MKDRGMDDLPPLLKGLPSEREERRRELGERAVGTPYPIGGVMMLISAGFNIVHAVLAPKVNPVPQGMGFSPGFQFVGMFFYLALGVGLFAGSMVARTTTLVLMGVVAAMIGGHAFNDKAVTLLPPRILPTWPAAETSVAANVAAASGGFTAINTTAVAAQMSVGVVELKTAISPPLPHGAWPLGAAAIGLIVGWALMLTPPPLGIKSYAGAVMVLTAQLLALWGLYL